MAKKEISAKIGDKCEMAPDVVAVSNCHAYCHCPNLSIIRRVCITYAVEHQRALHSKREMEQQQRSATVSRSNKVRSVDRVGRF